MARGRGFHSEVGRAEPWVWRTSGNNMTTTRWGCTTEGSCGRIGSTTSGRTRQVVAEPIGGRYCSQLLVELCEILTYIIRGGSTESTGGATRTRTCIGANECIRQVRRKGEPCTLEFNLWSSRWSTSSTGWWSERTSANTLGWTTSGCDLLKDSQYQVNLPFAPAPPPLFLKTPPFSWNVSSPPPFFSDEKINTN